MDDLKLYYRPTCPYCLKVIRFMQNNDIEIDMYATTEPVNNEYLLKHGGKSQVPCLFIADRAMYESDDIIDYLKENYVDKGK